MLWGKPLAQPVRPCPSCTAAAGRNSRVTSDMRSGLARDLGATGHQIDLGRTRIAALVLANGGNDTWLAW